MMKKDILRVGDIATTNRGYSFTGAVIRVTRVYTHVGGDIGVDGDIITEGRGRYYNRYNMGGWNGFERLYGFEDYYNEVK